MLDHGVGASLHILEHCNATVAWLWVLAGGAHAVGIEANAMCPTVEYNGITSGKKLWGSNGGAVNAATGTVSGVLSGADVSGMRMALASWNLACVLVSILVCLLFLP